MDDHLNKELESAQWRKASASGDNGNCLEVAPLTGGRVGPAPTRDRFHPEELTLGEFHAA